MKIETNNRQIESSGIKAQGQFSIKTSAQAFQLISSGLYSNKVKAVIRELSCNAADAHKMTGTSVPIEIKIPNALDNQFYVKDYGPGLDHDTLMKLYTTYFESTKSSNNDMTGGFGLGSKSPFAYTDSFTVESRQQGIKNIYTAFVDEDSIPNIAHLSTSETDEPDGLTVGFPVKPADFRKFEAEAVEVVSWFDTNVTLKGTSAKATSNLDKKNIAYSTKHVSIQGSKFVPEQRSILGHSNSHWQQRSHMVVMGNVAYPLQKQDEWKDNAKIRWLLQRNCIFPWSIGEVSIAVSREELAYDKQSLKNLPLILESAFDEVAQEIKKQIDVIWKKETGLKRDLILGSLIEYAGFEDPKMFSIFNDVVDLTPEMIKAMKPKTIYPFKLKTFDILVNTHSYNGNFGSPTTWGKAPDTPLPLRDRPGFVENIGGRFGKDIDTRWTLFKQKHSESSFYIIVPKANKALTPEYEEELTKWKNELGIELLDFLPRNKLKDDEIMVPATLCGRYGYYRSNDDQVLTSETPQFLWIPKDDLDSHQSISHHFEGFKKTLGLEKMSPLFAIDNKYAETVTKLTNGESIWTYFERELQNKKVMHKIEKIKPMLDGSSYMFSGLRNKYRGDASWKQILDNTKLGGWLKDMNYTKGSASYDFSTVRWLQFIKEKIPTLNITIPAYYKGADIESQLSEKYPLLLNKLLLKDKYVSNTTLVQIATGLQQYIKWAEENGMASPPHESTLSNDDTGPTP